MSIYHSPREKYLKFFNFIDIKTFLDQMQKKKIQQNVNKIYPDLSARQSVVIFA